MVVATTAESGEKQIVKDVPRDAGGKPLPFGGGRLGGFGRQKGTPNKSTREVKEAISRFLDDPDYQDNLMRRICDGRADHMEKYFWEVLHGRPKVVVEVGQPNTEQKSFAEQLAANLSKEERMQMADMMRRALGRATASETIVDGEAVEVKALPAPRRRRKKS